MVKTVVLAEYLFTRLRQLGVDSMHGVPGDYNLTLLDYVEPAGIHWVGNANELNAGYAADGYSRIKGIGALVTTFGVGELSAINAIAGAYSERAPVVHIVGTPMRDAQENRRLIHHTFNDGDFRRFGQMHAHVTVAQARLEDPRTCPEQIDEVLTQCLLHSRPVYIEVPADLVSVPVSASRLETKVKVPDTLATKEQDVIVDAVLEKIYAAKKPAILVDGESRALGILDDLHTLIKTSNWPTWVTGFGKGLVDETLPNVHGIYRGRFEQEAVKTFMEECDLILCFGPHFSWTNTYAYSSIPRADITIFISDNKTAIGTPATTCRDIPAKYLVTQLHSKLDYSRINRYNSTNSKCTSPPDIPPVTAASFSSVSPDQPLTQSKLWRLLATFLRPGDILLGEAGTAGYGCKDMPLPRHARLFSPVTWLSIGYMLPAAQGAALAQRELMASDMYNGVKDGRTVLMIGDGSFQMTVQELGTIVKEGLDVVVFLINNEGYTIERCIHGLRERYNDIATWKYLLMPEAFGGGEGGFVRRVKTWGELEAVLGDETMVNGKGLRFVELVVDREDAPEGMLSDMIKKQQEIEAKKEVASK